MMNISSEYTFPIFISSTDYNLKDFRAELARFLSELGYRPYLSSAEGFPDSSPVLEPWESCIPVLENCFVTILIIDGRYGTALNWPNYKEHFTDRKISPTHGEYLVAHKTKKRMLVFIRKELMPLYQSYRNVMKKCGNNKIEAEKLLAPVLSENISFQTLDFINEVKTTKPIPWINEFEDITSVKREIQKKMLNELAEIFLIKNRDIETVVHSFNKVMDSLTIEKQKEILQKINATKTIIDAVDKIEEYKKEIEIANANLKETETNNSEDKVKYETQIKSLKKKISELESETLKSSESQFFIENGQVRLGNPNYMDNGISGTQYGRSGYSGVTINSGLGIASRKCDNCGRAEHDPFTVTAATVFGNQFNTCPSCNRYLCSNCWPRYNGLSSGSIAYTIDNRTDKCPRCAQEERTTVSIK
ncbi:MAG: DUF4062 domain-containing protein [Bacteroidota bacterium]|nr:DUF4062 domain-containing protein [Bacteroidota bacterium]